MRRNVLAGILLMLVAVILGHDGSMVVGHAANDASVHHDASAQHRDHAEHDQTTVPESCGTVRLTTQRLSAPEPPVSEATHSLVLATDPSAFAAISETFLVVPVVPPPSACLARFQVFRI